MKAWKQGKVFLGLLKSDADITGVLPPDELEALFDQNYYLRYVDDIFERLGLTRVQWKNVIQENVQDLAPHSI